MAVMLSPGALRAERTEQWLADVHDAPGEGLVPSTVAAGALWAALICAPGRRGARPAHARATGKAKAVVYARLEDGPPPEKVDLSTLKVVGIIDPARARSATSAHRCGARRGRGAQLPSVASRGFDGQGREVAEARTAPGLVDVSLGLRRGLLHG